MNRSTRGLSRTPTYVAAIGGRTSNSAARPVGAVRLAEVISALTYALDLTGGQRPGHTLRTAVIALRLGEAIGVSGAELGALYYAALLKDAGCSSNAARMAAMFGAADQTVKREMRLVDWHDTWRAAMRSAQLCGVGLNPLARIAHFLRVAGTPQMTRDIIQLRCERGAQIAVALGFPPATSEAIAHVDEHWCGRGYPVGLAGTEIPLLSRIVLIAQTFDAFWTEHGVDGAMRMCETRRGRWFDPTLVGVLATWRRDAAFWSTLADGDRLASLVVSLEPGNAMDATEERLDKTSLAFAAVIDAKTPFTYRHSTNVSRYAVAIARAVGADDGAIRDIRRAGLLHDIGKLGVSNRILDKPDKLTDAERNEVKKHPLWTREILDRVDAFRHLAAGAAEHHERLDGMGYPWGLRADSLGLMSRVLAVADVYEALTADRPYRGGLSIDRTLSIMSPDVGGAFDATMFGAADELARTGVFAELASDLDGALGDGSVHPRSGSGAPSGQTFLSLARGTTAAA